MIANEMDELAATWPPKMPVSPFNIHKYASHERCQTGNRKMENVNCTPRIQVESARSGNGSAWSCENGYGNGNASALKISSSTKFELLFMNYSFRLELGWALFGLNTRKTQTLIGCA